MSIASSRLLVVIPTYNEVDNIGLLIQQLRSLLPNATLLIIDDNSFDGTSELVSQVASEQSNVILHSREQKLGIGSAHKHALLEAISGNYEILVTLDADFTHDPVYIEAMFQELTNADVVVGSRFLPGGGIREWNLFRALLTRAGHLATRLILRIPYDASGAFRMYRINKVRFAALTQELNDGYSWFYESLTVLHLQGLRIREIPIVLPARTYGSSKMRIRDATFSLLNMFRFRFQAKELSKHEIVG